MIEIGPLIKTEVGKVQFNFNPLFERHVRAEEDGETELSYQWQVKFRHAQAFEFGLQGFGEVGEWNDWEESEDQEHMAGPAVFGKLPVGEHALKYDAALLFGLNDHTADNTLRVRLEYEF